MFSARRTLALSYPWWPPRLANFKVVINFFIIQVCKRQYLQIRKTIISADTPEDFDLNLIIFVEAVTKIYWKAWIVYPIMSVCFFRYNPFRSAELWYYLSVNVKIMFYSKLKSITENQILAMSGNGVFPLYCHYCLPWWRQITCNSTKKRHKCNIEGNSFTVTALSSRPS